MWEISLSIDKSMQDSMQSLVDRMASTLKEVSGVMSFDGDEHRAYLTVACEEENRERLELVLTDEITKIFIDDFKQDYLKSNARLPLTNPINYNAFIRALVSFDSEIDREIVEKALVLQNGLKLEGFFNFKLTELKERWKEVCDLANDNAAYLGYQQTFVELMRFLINTLEGKTEEIIIEKSKEIPEYRIFDCKTLSTTFCDTNTLLSSIIGLAPSIINVYEDNALPEYLLSLLQGLYGSRVKFIRLT